MFDCVLGKIYGSRTALELEASSEAAKSQAQRKQFVPGILPSMLQALLQSRITPGPIRIPNLRGGNS